MDTRLELCFYYEDDPVIQERKAPSKDQLPHPVLSYEQWLHMWKLAEHWRIDRQRAEAAWSFTCGLPLVFHADMTKGSIIPA